MRPAKSRLISEFPKQHRFLQPPFHNSSNSLCFRGAVPFLSGSILFCFVHNYAPLDDLAGRPRLGLLFIYPLRRTMKQTLPKSRTGRHAGVHDGRSLGGSNAFAGGSRRRSSGHRPAGRARVSHLRRQHACAHFLHLVAWRPMGQAQAGRRQKGAGNLCLAGGGTVSCRELDAQARLEEICRGRRRSISRGPRRMATIFIP